MKKILIIIILLIAVISFTGYIYINYEKDAVDYYYNLGINQEFNFYNLYFGFDTSYYSPDFSFETGTFKAGFSKYDVWIGFNLNKFQIEYFHRCIHELNAIQYNRWKQLNYFDTGKNVIKIKLYF